MIVWKHHRKGNDLIMVYGFLNKDDRNYSIVLTLYIKNKLTKLYGFLDDKSKVKLSLADLKILWKFLRKIVSTKYVILEALPEHALFYKHYLPVIETKQSLTFNGFDSELLKIKVGDLIKD